MNIFRFISFDHETKKYLKINLLTYNKVNHSTTILHRDQKCTGGRDFHMPSISEKNIKSLLENSIFTTTT